jgi:cysteine-rich repeat protein
MERIGARSLTGSQKAALMRRIGRSLVAGEPRWAADLLRACPAFEEIYGRSAASFVRTLKERADCVLTATHGNNSLICIPQVCPNGIVEPGEECDDGNQDDADACGNDCTAR